MSRSHLIAVAALLGGALLAPAATATASADVTVGVRTAAAGPAGKSPSDTPLVRATEALNGEADPGSLDRPEATLALRDLFLARPTLGDLGGKFADGLLARPTQGSNDPYGDGYTARSTKRCSTHFCVHWVRSGADAPPSSWPGVTLTVLEQVWRHHIGKLGYRAPAPDGRTGGNAKFDVYLKDVGARGLYGYCAPERRVGGGGKRASGFCVLDDDFARNQFGRAPKQSLRVTAAHEFFHAIQFNYDYTEDPWLLESTATWMEERSADDVNDNRAYLRFGQLARPRVPLDLFETSGYAHYGNWTFWEYLSNRYGTRIVRDVWNRVGTKGLPDDYSTQGLKNVLASRGGLARNYAAFASGNTVPARTYPEGSAYPAAPVVARRLSSTERRTKVTMRLDHLTSRSVRIRPDGSLGAATRLTVKVNGPDRVHTPAAHLLVVRADGSTQRRPIPLTKSGYGAVKLPFSTRSVRSVTVTMANVSTRYQCYRGTSLACEGRPLDQRQPFELKAFVGR